MGKTLPATCYLHGKLGTGGLRSVPLRMGRGQPAEDGSQHPSGDFQICVSLTFLILLPISLNIKSGTFLL